MFSLHEETNDRADVCTAHGTAVERSHCVRTTLAKAWHYANPSRGATRQTSQQSAGSSGAAAAGSGAVEVVAVDAVDCSSSLSLSVAGWLQRYRVGAELTARRNCKAAALLNSVKSTPSLSTPAICVFSLPLSVLYLLFPNCFSNLLIPPPCSLVSVWAFCHSTCVLSWFHHYTFHLLPVLIYTQAFPCCFLYLISNHASVLLTCLFLLELPYMHSWLELPTPTCCSFKPHVHY